MRDLLDGTALCVTEYWDPACPADRYSRCTRGPLTSHRGSPRSVRSPLSWRHRATPVKSLNRKVIKDATGPPPRRRSTQLGDRD